MFRLHLLWHVDVNVCVRLVVLRRYGSSGSLSKRSSQRYFKVLNVDYGLEFVCHAVLPTAQGLNALAWWSALMPQLAPCRVLQ
ncbi:hypothetical protein N7447_008634 [Penicillium robsamsonii]|uniref:uncharacterized protein n=1 Tax=Penicillium robsamsonii TaxID=1792511 RepID=UPI0025471214|nr:uncharacterized protein N7447_008634 [Penicillium robsamsonii]KAJ5816401.1 hypothetical protein N7447_008634 [Penicillium robsamsonii]